MAVTQKQIGEKLGVTQQAVALALQGHPSVPERTRNRIIETAKEMGYHKYSNRHARMLTAHRHGKRAATGILAVLLDAPYPHAPATEIPYFREMMDGIEGEAERHEMDVLIVAVRNARLPWLIAEGWVDGVVCIGNDELYGLEKLGLPIVTAGYPHSTVTSVMPDATEGVRMLVNHLIKLGHRRIGYLGTEPHPSGLQRLDAYRQVLKENGLEVDESIIQLMRAWREADAHGEGLELLLARDRQHQIKIGNPVSKLPSFSALVCYNDPMAMDSIRKAKELGIRVPRDLSVVGFDDVSTRYNFQPAVTTVRIPLQDMGRRAVQLICKQFALGSNGTGQSSLLTPVSTSTETVQHEIIPVELVARESTAKARGIRPDTAKRRSANTA
jgi:LacI family transcriptional regulator